MSNRLFLGLQILVVLVSAGYSFSMSSKLPAVVPTHWGISGKPDAYGSAAMDLWLMPAVEVFTLLLTFALPQLSPKRYEVTRFSKTYGYAMFLVTLLMGVLHFVIVNAAAGARFDMTKAMMLVMFGFFTAIGNVMGKVKQNFFMGVRTPWTLADGRVWDHTHREAGILWLAGGLVGMLLALLGVNFMVLISYLMVIAFTPVVRSYIWYRRLVTSEDAARQ